MYSTLLLIHSLLRWLVLFSLLFSIAIAINGYLKKKEFTPLNNAFRHWTATICHIQLMVGIILYTQSPQIKFYFGTDGKSEDDPFFFSVLHMVLMLAAIIVITIGSAKAKRQITTHKKFKTMSWWFLAGLILILVAIPWPFSPLANRPYIRF